ncbi:hypothetical protein CVT24_003247 [Panaeolus cyanescens]|uniref:Uncharacterized protein n=1 Tax=Panaeolus cyanescens TaxID=181874 RepID=A0A409YXK7_9AGAR|nr:hypothetical protein CVT24_003247 [Panaeolus cyanescens]
MSPTFPHPPTLRRIVSASERLHAREEPRHFNDHNPDCHAAAIAPNNSSQNIRPSEEGRPAAAQLVSAMSQPLAETLEQHDVPVRMVEDPRRLQSVTYERQISKVRGRLKLGYYTTADPALNDTPCAPMSRVPMQSLRNLCDKDIFLHKIGANPDRYQAWIYSSCNNQWSELHYGQEMRDMGIFVINSKGQPLFITLSSWTRYYRPPKDNLHPQVAVLADLAPTIGS